MGTSAERSSCSTNYYSRGDVLPGIWVDGMDVLAVKNATEFAIKYATEVGALLLEVKTYRYSGHSMSDPGTSYRSREEVQDVRQSRDPITLFKERLIANDLLTADEIKAIDNDIKKKVDAATKISRSDKEIAVAELYTDIYAKPLETDIRGLTATALHKHTSLNKGVNIK